MPIYLLGIPACPSLLSAALPPLCCPSQPSPMPMPPSPLCPTHSTVQFLSSHSALPSQDLRTVCLSVPFSPAQCTFQFLTQVVYVQGLLWLLNVKNVCKAIRVSYVSYWLNAPYTHKLGRELREVKQRGHTSFPAATLERSTVLSCNRHLEA